MAIMKVNELHRIKEKGAPTSFCFRVVFFLSVSSAYVEADVQRRNLSSYPTRSRSVGWTPRRTLLSTHVHSNAKGQQHTPYWHKRDTKKMRV